MPLATVLMPTHDHVETLRFSIPSVLAQTLSDFEFFIVGDGIGDATRAIVAEIAGNDRRVRLFDFPKGPRKGERHRHEVLMKEATGRFVAYLGDDDLWMPHHLKTLAGVLEEVHFANTLHVGINGEGKFFWLPSDLANREFRARMLRDPPFNTFDMSFGAHRLSAYRRLKTGWAPPSPPPPSFDLRDPKVWVPGQPGTTADLFLWRQFLAERWCRAKSVQVPTGICTQTHLRPGMTDHERAEELGRLAATFAPPRAWNAFAALLETVPAGRGFSI